MNFNLKKKPANQVIASAIEQLAGENKSLEVQKNASLSIFKNTVLSLQTINSQLEHNTLECIRLAEELNLQADNTKVEIAANKKVIDKILEIFN